MNRRDPINNRDIALNWQGLPLPVSLKLAVCLTELLNTHKPTWQQARAVTMNFRDPSYGPESGGFHPVEIRLQRRGKEGLVAHVHIVPLSELHEFYELWESNFLSYLSLGVYTLTLSCE